jgi:phage terminase large subunit
MVTATECKHELVRTAEGLACAKCGGKAQEINLEPAQGAFFNSTARHPAFIGGRGSGKTYVLVVKAFNLALTYPGIRGVITEPTFGMIRDNLVPVIDKVYGAFQKRPPDQENLWDYRLIVQGTPQEISFTNGSLISLRPVDDPDKFRGSTRGFFAMDEVAVGIQQYDAFMVMALTLRQEGMPCQGFVVSTPSASKPWIKKMWKENVTPKGESPLDPEIFPLFQMSMDENPYLPESEKIVNRMLYGGTEKGRSEQLGGQFVGLEGAAFEEFGESHIRPMNEADEADRKIVGLDFGKSSPTAAVEIWYNKTFDRVWVTREFYKRDCVDYDWIEAVGEWNVPEIICDPSRSEKELIDLRRMYGLPGLRRARPIVKGFDGRKQRLRTRLAMRPDGKPGIFISPDCPNLIDEISNLAQKELRGGEISLNEWAPGLRDHAYDGLCYALGEVDRGYGELTNTKVKWSSG